MSELNLDAAEKWGKSRTTASNESVPDSALAAEIGPQLANVLVSIQDHQRRTRTGLALTFGAIFPGLGPLFMGAYLFAFVYAVAFIGCSYMAVTSANILLGRLISWPWFWGAMAVWLVSFLHTGIMLTRED